MAFGAESKRHLHHVYEYERKCCESKQKDSVDVGKIARNWNATANASTKTKEITATPKRDGLMSIEHTFIALPNPDPHLSSPVAALLIRVHRFCIFYRVRQWNGDGLSLPPEHIPANNKFSIKERSKFNCFNLLYFNCVCFFTLFGHLGAL